MWAKDDLADNEFYELMLAALLATSTSLTSAQEVSAELNTWLQENALGPHAAMDENWDDIVAKAR